MNSLNSNNYDDAASMGAAARNTITYHNKNMTHAIGEIQSLGFQLNPNRYVNSFYDCALDKKCKIFYHHVAKTGGTHIEQKFQDLFKSPKLCSGCYATIMDRFRKRTELYCKLPFSSYQVNVTQFEQIVQTCLTYDFVERALLLTSYREPLTKTVSKIHQICNKNLDRRDNYTRYMCTTQCDKYDANRGFWDKFVNVTTRDLRESQYVTQNMVHHLNDNIIRNSKEKKKSVEAFAIDTIDIDTFFAKLLDEEDDEVEIHYNTEKKSRCDFRVSSSMMKLHTEATLIYRNLTIGM